LDENTKYPLYTIDKFFVEVIVDNEKDGIIGKGQFKEGKSLDRYSNVPREILILSSTNHISIIPSLILTI